MNSLIKALRKSDAVRIDEVFQNKFSYFDSAVRDEVALETQVIHFSRNDLDRAVKIDRINWIVKGRYIQVLTFCGTAQVKMLSKGYRFETTCPEKVDLDKVLDGLSKTQPIMIMKQNVTITTPAPEGMLSQIPITECTDETFVAVHAYILRKALIVGITAPKGVGIRQSELYCTNNPGAWVKWVKDVRKAPWGKKEAFHDIPCKVEIIFPEV